MLKHEVRTPIDAWCYMTDCTLATVSSMALTKSRKKGEYQRQISIAQSAINWMQDMGVHPVGTRAIEVIERFDGSVAMWAAEYEVERGK